MYNKNLILDTDSYKASHWLQYPEGTTNVYSYLESRGGEYEETVFFGLQPLLRRLSQKVTPEMVDEAAKFFEGHGLPFNRDGWMYIAEDLGGKLPLRIKAVAEGSVVPTKNVLMTVENTDDKCFWLTSWVETLLMRVWYPTTVATISRECKKVIFDALKRTSDDPQSEIGFKLHDFGSRGVSSSESAALGGAAHLVNFMGSDTVLGVLFANEMYNAGMAGFSIPAAEHSTVTSYGKEGELDAYRNMLNQFAKPNALLAVVSDSYDLGNAVRNLWGKELKQQIIDSGAVVVVRPDSGHPPKVVLETLIGLDEAFGHTINSKGFKVLNHVRVIQGDGINRESIREILEVAESAGFSATNIAFGMGGGLLQQMNRDTLKFAYKCSSIRVNGEERGVYKEPKDEPFKRSKAGRFSLVKTSLIYYTSTEENEPHDVLQVVFENGDVLLSNDFEGIRKRAEVR